jgi:hypothetical protein
MRATPNFAATAAYFEHRLRKATAPARRAKLRAAADLYRQKALSLGHDLPAEPDEAPMALPATSRRDRVAAMFRTYGVTGAADQK